MTHDVIIPATDGSGPVTVSKLSIHDAMERCGGKTSAAARFLKIPPSKLYTLIHNDAELKLRWAKKVLKVSPPNGAVTLHRGMLPPVIREPTSEEIAKAIEEEDKLVKAGVAAIGVKGDALEMAIALKKLQNRHYRSCIEMVSGGATKQYLDNLAEIKRITDFLNSEEGQKADYKEKLMLREDRAKLMEINAKLHQQVNQAVLTQAKVKSMQNQQAGGPGRSKPGFSPLMHVHGDVTIQEQPRTDQPE